MCQRRGVLAWVYEEHIRESVCFFYCFTDRWTTWIVCPLCRAKLQSRSSAADLEGKTPAELFDEIYFDEGFVAKFLAVAAFVLAICPLLGTVLAVIALIANIRSPNWPQKLSLLALQLSLLAVIVLVAVKNLRH